MNAVVTPKPTPVAYDFDAIPDDFKTLPNWMLWKYQQRGGKWTKVPYQANGKAADSTDSSTWASFEDALFSYELGDFDGLGFAIGDSGLTCIDIDHISDWDMPRSLTDLKDSTYSEVSPSGDGLHLWMRVKKPNGKCKSSKFYSSQVEVYNSDRYITMTGNSAAGEVSNHQEHFNTVFKDLFFPVVVSTPEVNLNTEPLLQQSDDEIIRRVSAEKNGHKWSGWHEFGAPESADQSAYDRKYVNKIAFYTKDFAQIERIWLSGAMGRREKVRDRKDYRERTINKAIADVANYSGKATTKQSKGMTLDSFVISNFGEMREMLANDSWVLDRIALEGQITHLFAQPNSGKTLLTLKLLFESVKAGRIKGKNVYYVNSDDTLRGLVTKGELAGAWGIKMLANGWNNFKNSDLTGELERLAENDEAKGKIVVLDTLKKFTDLMNKNESSNFNDVMRAFVSKGGTIIALAHVNKSRDIEGKLIYQGTSDSVDDADCCYTIDLLESVDNSYHGAKVNDFTVQFENFKARGDNIPKVAYTYTKREGASYEDLLNSVTQVDEGLAAITQMKAQINSKLNENEEGIEIVLSAIEHYGANANTQNIVTNIMAEGLSRAKANKLLKAHCGDDYSKGHRWQKQKGDKNEYIYKALN